MLLTIVSIWAAASKAFVDCGTTGGTGLVANLIGTASKADLMGMCLIGDGADTFP